MMRALLRLVAAIAGGVALNLAFAPASAWYLAPVGIAILVLVARDERWWRAALWGFVFGLTYSLITLQWLNPVGIDTTILLSGLFGVWFALTALGIRWVWNLPLAPLWVGAVWVLLELLFGNVPLGGFGWLRLAFGQSDAPVVSAAAYLGVAGITFAVAVTGALLARLALFGTAAIKQRPNSRELLLAGVSFAIVVLLVAGGALVPRSGQIEAEHGDPTITIAAVQGGVPGAGLNSLGRQTQVIRNHVDQTNRLAAEVAAGTAPQPDLVVWPENSTDIDPLRNPSVKAWIDDAAAAIKAPILVGAVRVNDTDPVTLHNSGVLWEPNVGPTQEYVKQYLVPFGEYMPMRGLISKLTDRVSLVPTDFVPGDQPGVFTVANTRIGDLICYEILSNSTVNNLARQDVDLLVLQANNATYTHTGPGGLNEAEQLLDIAKVRAVETGKSIVLGTTNGITAVIGSDGAVIEQIPSIQPGSLVVDVPLRTLNPPATRLGPLVEYALALIGVIGIAAGAWTARRSRQ